MGCVQSEGLTQSGDTLPAQSEEPHELPPESDNLAVGREMPRIISVLQFELDQLHTAELKNAKDALAQSPRQARSDLDGEQAREEILRILVDLFPSWQPFSVEVKPLHGGAMNLAFNVRICPENKSESIPDRVLFRIYGPSSLVITDRQLEEDVFFELTEIGMGPKQHGKFGNGRVEEFFDGFDSIDVKENLHGRQVSKSIAQFHSIHPKSLKSQREPQAFRRIDAWFAIACDAHFYDETKQKQYLRMNIEQEHAERIESFKTQVVPSDEELDKTAEEIVQMPIEDFGRFFMFMSVFNHGDLHGGNIMFSSELNEVRLIDFEFARYDYRAVDLCGWFQSFVYYEDTYEKYPSDKELQEFLEVYCRALCVAVKDNKEFSSDVDRAVVKRLTTLFSENDQESERSRFFGVCIRSIFEMTLIMTEFWGLWSIVSAQESSIDWDYLGFAETQFGPMYEFCQAKLLDFKQ